MKYLHKKVFTLRIVGVAVGVLLYQPISNALDFDDFLEGSGDISGELDAIDSQVSNQDRILKQKLKDIRAQDSDYYNQSNINMLKNQADERDRIKREHEEAIAAEKLRREEHKRELALAEQERRNHQERLRQEKAIADRQYALEKEIAISEHKARQNQIQLEKQKILEQRQLAEKQKQLQLQIDKRNSQQQANNQARPQQQQPTQQRRKQSVNGCSVIRKADDYMVEVSNGCADRISYIVCVRTYDERRSTYVYSGKVGSNDNRLISVGNSLNGYKWRFKSLHNYSTPSHPGCPN